MRLNPLSKFFNKKRGAVDEAEEQVTIPELGTPERVKHFVSLRNKAITNVKEARVAHQEARANR